MIRKILLPSIFVVLAYGFWISPDFKEISAGVAIFLFGMVSLEEGFKAFTGGLLERLLRRTTDKLWKSLTFGVVTTTIMQSSSLVSVITISFLSAGLIGLASGVGIIFGANLGTTTGAWLIAGFGLKVKISAYAMPMLVFGVILMFQKSRSLKGIGYILAGLGFLFLGIHHMKMGFESFKDTIDLAAYAVPGFTGLLIFTALGVFATVVMQSSHATLVLIITALSVQQITYDNALALAIGANIGTTITAILGSLSANVEGKRLAGAHLIFNLVTGAVAIIFIHQIMFAVDSISAAVGIPADDYTLKLAVFHTIFNTLGIILMIPFINTLVNFLTKTFKEKRKGLVEPRYLNEASMEFPEAVLESVRKETVHLYENAFEVIAHGISLKPDVIHSKDDLADLVHRPGKVVPFDIDAQYDLKVKVLYNAIIEYISRSQQSMPAEYSEKLFGMRQAARDIVEAVKDTKHLQKNLSRYIASDNDAIRREYNHLRVQIANVLRQLQLMRNNNEDDTVLSLDMLKVEMEKTDASVNGMMDKLIRENAITAPMATSLMNDSGYAYDISRNLVEMGATLFADHDLDVSTAESSIALDQDEIDEILANKEND